MTLRSLLALIPAASLLLSVAHANTTIGFDDLGDSSSGNAVPNGYAGFDWNNVYWLTPGDGFYNAYGYNGYSAGVVSPSNDAYNGYAADATMTSATPFTLVSVNLADAWFPGQNAEITALDQLGNPITSDVFSVNWSSSTLETVNWSGIYGVDFSSDGGAQLAIDNIVVGSAPDAASTAVLFGAASAGLAYLRRKRA